MFSTWIRKKIILNNAAIFYNQIYQGYLESKRSILSKTLAEVVLIDEISKLANQKQAKTLRANDESSLHHQQKTVPKGTFE